MNKLALFDCDGTLVDSQANICLCMQRTFESAGLAPPPSNAIRRLVGLSLAELVTALTPASDHAVRQSLVTRYRATFFALHEGGLVALEPLFDGISPLLAQLIDKGWLLGVATGKSDRGLARVLSKHGIADHFITLQTADRHPSKPHPSMVHEAMADAGAAPETTIVIGDTSYDMMMAAAAGARGLGVAWGYHPPEELSAAGAFAVAQVPSDIARLMEA
ncbi:MAG: HAD-IA family hydrolase [Sphingomonadaceae bacterium]